MSDFLPGYEVSNWFGLGVPRNTPAEVVNILNKAVTDTNLKGRLSDLGGTIISGSPADFGRLIVDETEKWGEVIRVANIKPE